MEKYYVPKIEDFYVGFEFEIQNIENAQWGKCICTPGFGAFDSDIDDLEEKRIRVKYLDKYDIKEVLGVKQLKGDDVELNFQFFIDDREDIFYEVDYDTEDKILTVERFLSNQDGTWRCYTLFLGKIINKSELKKLLKQLNIKQ